MSAHTGSQSRLRRACWMRQGSSISSRPSGSGWSTPGRGYSLRRHRAGALGAAERACRGFAHALLLRASARQQRSPHADLNGCKNKKAGAVAGFSRSELTGSRREGPQAIPAYLPRVPAQPQRVLLPQGPPLQRPPQVLLEPPGRQPVLPQRPQLPARQRPDGPAPGIWHHPRPPCRPLHGRFRGLRNRRHLAAAWRCGPSGRVAAGSRSLGRCAGPRQQRR